MAVSKNRSAQKKKAGKKASSTKERKTKSPARKQKSSKTAKSAPVQAAKPSRKKPAKSDVEPNLNALEEALAGARSQITSLIEDRETQIAIAEGADAERSMLQDELEEARETIRKLEQKLSEREAPQPLASPDGGEIDFEEEEEPPDVETEDLDDVESIYTRMDDPRVRRQELDRERMDRESEVSDEPYWLVCPKCGGTLEEADAGEVKIERCENCGGLYLDQGEVEMLLTVSRGPEGLQRVRGILQF